MRSRASLPKHFLFLNTAAATFTTTRVFARSGNTIDERTECDSDNQEGDGALPIHGRGNVKLKSSKAQEGSNLEDE